MTSSEWEARSSSSTSISKVSVSGQNGRPSPRGVRMAGDVDQPFTDDQVDIGSETIGSDGQECRGPRTLSPPPVPTDGRYSRATLGGACADRVPLPLVRSAGASVGPRTAADRVAPLQVTAGGSADDLPGQRARRARGGGAPFPAGGRRRCEGLKHPIVQIPSQAHPFLDRPPTRADAAEGIHPRGGRLTAARHRPRSGHLMTGCGIIQEEEAGLTFSGIDRGG